MDKQYAKWVGLLLALIAYFAGFWLIYGSAPGINISGVLIVTVLWFTIKFVLSGEYKDDELDPGASNESE